MLLAALITVVPLVVRGASEPTPEELGAVDSPIAFLDTCTKTRGDFDVAMQEVKDSGEGIAPTELEMAQAFVAITEVFCAGMIRAVSETILADPDYRLEGQRVCFDPKTSIPDVVAAAQKLMKKESNFVKEARLTTPQFILYVLHKEFSC